MATAGRLRRSEIPVPRKRGRMTPLEKLIVELSAPSPTWAYHSVEQAHLERVLALQACKYLKELLPLSPTKDQLWTLGYLLYGHPLIHPGQSSDSYAPVRSRVQWGTFLEDSREAELLDAGAAAYLAHPVWRADYFHPDDKLRNRPETRKREAVNYVISLEAVASPQVADIPRWVDANGVKVAALVGELAGAAGAFKVGQAHRGSGTIWPTDEQVLGHISWGSDYPGLDGLRRHQDVFANASDWFFNPTRPDMRLSGPLKLLVSYFQLEQPGAKHGEVDMQNGRGQLRTLKVLAGDVQQRIARSVADSLERCSQEKGLPLKCTSATMEPLASYRAERPRGRWPEYT